MSHESSGNALIAGIMLYLGGFAAYRERQRILDTPTAYASSAAIGLVEMRGIALGDPPDPSPVTGTSCAYWEAELWEYSERNKDRKWACIAREYSKADHLWLEDKTGRIAIVLHGAAWTLEGESEFPVPGEPALPESAHAFLLRHHRVWDAKKLRIRERRLEHGAEVYAMGTLSEAVDIVEPRIGAGPKGGAAHIVTIVHAIASNLFAMTSVYRSDGRRIGSRTGRPLWAHGNPTMRANDFLLETQHGHALTRRLEPEVDLPTWLKAHDTVIWHGPRRNPFRIANCNEGVLTRRLAQTAWGGVALGTALILLSFVT